MNRNQAVSSLKEVLSESQFLFPNHIDIKKIDSTHYKVYIKGKSADIQLLQSIAHNLGYIVKPGEEQETESIEIT